MSVLGLALSLQFGSAGMVGAHAGGRAGAFIDPSLLLLLLACMMVLSAYATWRGRRAPLRPAPHPHAFARLVAQGLGVGLLTGLMGAGGGFLITPALVLWAGLPMPAAVGTSLLIIVLNALAGFSGYASHVRIDFHLVASLAAAAVAGSFVGARLAARIDHTSLRRAFAGFVLGMGAGRLVPGSGARKPVARVRRDPGVRVGHAGGRARPPARPHSAARSSSFLAASSSLRAAALTFG